MVHHGVKYLEDNTLEIEKEVVDVEGKMAKLSKLFVQQPKMELKFLVR